MATADGGHRVFASSPSPIGASQPSRINATSAPHRAALAILSANPPAPASRKDEHRRACVDNESAKKKFNKQESLLFTFYL
ncbi:hypothetical protein G5B88_16425 [Herbaspirillum seropedicae]|uniref:hypothetical protein n=1 Tax=Herbaspirillum seropedicae TaxID=964 RepID=UPI000A711395|nr:hypothetical protein [Herbaspirillum seropedicae]UMU22633.1 hypothetical protein G5B88_16425 [Herbaspirillum seropedicae]